jgi:hypothetical protein
MWYEFQKNVSPPVSGLKWLGISGSSYAEWLVAWFVNLMNSFLGSNLVFSAILRYVWASSVNNLSLPQKQIDKIKQTGKLQ